MDSAKKNKKGLKIFLCILAAIVIIFAVLCAVYPHAAYMTFRNLTASEEKLPETDDWTGGTSYINVQYCDVSENDYVSIYVPDGVENPPLMVIVHGGGFVADDNTNRASQHMYRYFRDHGFACASVNYRLAQEAAYPAALEDVKSCIRYLKANAGTYGYNADNIAIFGESAGGYLACAAALSNDDEFNSLPFIGEDEAVEPISAEVDVLIDFYGATYFRGVDEYWAELKMPKIIVNIANSWLSGDVLEGWSNVESFWLRKELDSLTDEEYRGICMTGFIEDNLPERDDLAIWISHGDCDITVPMLVSQHFYDELSAVMDPDDLYFNIVHNAGHAKDLMFTDTELKAVEEFTLAHFN